VQSVPTYAVTKIVTIIKSLTARQIFQRYPQVKKQLWGGEFCADGYFASTVSKHGNETTIANYVKNKASPTLNYMKIDNSRSFNTPLLAAG
jgi:putative transposase